MIARRWLACAFWASALSLALAAAGVAISREYYAVAPYHHDSAASRMYAVKLAETRRTDGLGAALGEVLATRDSLEPTVRLLVAPTSLRLLRGHLVTSVPLLALFLTLVAGLSDYWRESSATWLLGSAVVCWLASDGLRRRGWAAACGVMLAALVPTRQVAAVYGLAALAPLAARLLPRAFGRRGDAIVRARLLGVLSSAAAAVVAVVLLAGEKLYDYYFVTAWDYGSRADVVRFLTALAPVRLGLGPLAVVAAAATVIVARGRPSRREWFEIGWLSTSMPLIVVLSGALYHGTFALATPLLVVAGALALGTVRDARPVVALGLVAVTVAVSAAQVAVTRRYARTLATSTAATRTFYTELTGAVLGRDPSARYGRLFDAFDTIFVNTALFDRGIWPRGSVSTHTVIDSYYRRAFPGLDASAAGRRNLDALGAQAGTLAAAFCTPADVAKSLPSQPYSREAGSVASAALRDDPRWKAVRRFDAPAGCVLLYERVERALTLDEKWAAVPDRAVSTP